MAIPEQVEAFAALFRGRRDVYGTMEGGQVKEPITLEHYRKHLDGEQSLGVYLVEGKTCYFFAIDIDEPKWELALRVRTLLVDAGAPVYIALSKRGRYHIYGFLNAPCEALQVRSLAYAALYKARLWSANVSQNKEWLAESGLKRTPEVFPKQDVTLLPEEVVERAEKQEALGISPYGNYINIPYFGDKRTVLSVDGKPAPLDVWLTKVVRIDVAQVQNITNKLFGRVNPLEVRADDLKELEAEAKKRGRKKKIPRPPCIERMLEGVESGQRDESAFALARHYLDQNLSPTEILSILRDWDSRNAPPIGVKVLEEKIRSAVKGYPFGCNSIQGNDLLNVFCVGEEKCPVRGIYELPALVLLDPLPKVRAALDFVAETAFVSVQADVNMVKMDKGKVVGRIVDTTNVAFTSEKECFIATPPQFSSRGYIMLRHIMVPKPRCNTRVLQSYMADTLDRLPSFAEVFRAIRDQYLYYLDYDDPVIYNTMALWCIGSYFFPLFFAYPYVHFEGARATGKTKSLQVTSHMAFNAVFAGNVSTASLYRLVEASRCTLLIDETEVLKDHSERGEDLRNILNNGYKPDGVVYRIEKIGKDQLVPMPFETYSPKMLASIASLEPVLSSRCIEVRLLRPKSDEKANRPVDDKQPIWQEIRDKLYLLVLSKWSAVRRAFLDMVGPQVAYDIAYGKGVIPPNPLSAREWEIWRPLFALAMLVEAEGEQGLLLSLVEYAGQGVAKRKEEQEEERTGIFANALLKFVTEEGYYAHKMLKSWVLETVDETEVKFVTPKWIGKCLSELGLEKKRKINGRYQRFLSPELVREAYIRFFGKIPEYGETA